MNHDTESQSHIEGRRRPAPGTEDDWEYWSGGVMPLPRDTLVHVRYRDGGQTVEPRPAHFFDVLWRHDGMHRANDVVAYRLADVRTGSLPIAANAQPAGFTYLASPYSLLADKDAAARLAAQAAAHLMRKGEVVYSPIVHGHALAAYGLPLDWGFWKAQCRPFVDAASRLVVLEMDGWGESTGVQWEIGEFRRAGKPVEFMGLDELVRAGAGERRAA